ncbi:MAG: aspartate/glutamate racemase family protein, partial [Ruminococcus flavefaciens]|nr:aspartate/glutamate racemase family protein [Ruminococcus flavefaciens]
MYQETIALIGGFGAYATLDFFKKIIEKFPAEKEFERPRIIMDNNFPMPSRVRAILYGEHYQQIVEDIANSMQFLLNGGADYIILVCSTAHAFLPEVLKLVPSAENKVVSLTECITNTLEQQKKSAAIVLASEGALDTKVYDKALQTKNITTHSPGKDKYPEIRNFIESVKQNTISRETMLQFMDFCFQLTNSSNTNDIILGCTELPI